MPRVETRAMAVKNSCPMCILEIDNARWVDLAAMLGDEAPCDSCADKVNTKAAKEDAEQVHFLAAMARPHKPRRGLLAWMG